MAQKIWPYNRMMFKEAMDFIAGYAGHYVAAFEAAGVPKDTFEPWLYWLGVVDLMVVAKFHKWENERRRITHELLKEDQDLL